MQRLDEIPGGKLLFPLDCGDLGADELRIGLDGDELDRWQWVDLDRLDRYIAVGVVVPHQRRSAVPGARGDRGAGAIRRRAALVVAAVGLYGLAPSSPSRCSERCGAPAGAVALPTRIPLEVIDENAAYAEVRELTVRYRG